jgi:hypothetical protein
MQRYGSMPAWKSLARSVAFSRSSVRTRAVSIPFSRAQARLTLLFVVFANATDVQSGAIGNVVNAVVHHLTGGEERHKNEAEKLERQLTQLHKKYHDAVRALTLLTSFALGPFFTILFVARAAPQRRLKLLWTAQDEAKNASTSRSNDWCGRHYRDCTCVSCRM